MEHDKGDLFLQQYRQYNCPKVNFDVKLLPALSSKQGKRFQNNNLLKGECVWALGQVRIYWQVSVPHRM